MIERVHGTRAGVLLAGALLAALPLCLAAQGGPSVVARADPPSVTVGDRVRLVVTVTHARGATVTWPEDPKLAPFELISLRVPAPDGDDTTSSAELELTAFELGALTVPSFEVAVTDPDGTTVALATPAAPVTVATVGRDAGGDIRDIKAPLSMPFSVMTLLPWLLGAAAVTAAVWWLRRWLRRRARPAVPTPTPPPPRPAHEVAYEALAALETSGLLELGEVKTYHIRVSDIVRVYIEGRFGIEAMELTTADLLDRLRTSPVATDVLDDVRALLERCDLVKFAKHRPAPDASRALVPSARDVVDRTRPAETPTEETRVA